jgi:GNAT superfamily N-acetyltransferase
LEDIFIRAQFRSHGIGKHVMRFIVDQAMRRDCGRIEWQVLDWNKPAISFYDAIGATPMKQWIPYRISADSFDIVRSTLSSTH